MSKANELIKLKEMLDEGLISKDEFERLKQNLLDDEEISTANKLDNPSKIFGKLFSGLNTSSDFYEDKNDSEFFYDYIDLSYESTPEFTDNVFIYFQSDKLIEKLIIQPYFEFEFNSSESNWDKRNEINYVGFRVKNAPYGDNKIQIIEDQVLEHIEKNLNNIKKQFAFLNIDNLRNYKQVEKTNYISEDKLINKILSYLYNIERYLFVGIEKGRRGKGWFRALDPDAIGYFNGIEIKYHCQKIYDNHVGWHQNKGIVKEFSKLSLVDIENGNYPEGITNLIEFIDKIENENSEVFHSEESSPHNLLLRFYFETLQINKWFNLAKRVNGNYKSSWQRTQNEFTLQKHQWTSEKGIKKIGELKIIELICTRVSGIGDKRASEIADKFDTLEELYSLNLDEIKKAISPTYGERVYYYLQDNLQLKDSKYLNIKYLSELFY